MTTATRTTLIASVECANCGVIFGLSTFYMAERRDDHHSFYCPNGHRQHFPQESETERLKRQLDSAKTRTDYWRDEQARTERRRRAAVGQVTKIKRRVGRGVCPCCNRTFANLAAHMEGQHPEFALDAS